MPACIRDGAAITGGVVGYPLKQLYEEVAFVAYHFHWNQAEIMNMEHGDRRHWVKEISGINGRMNQA
jgi:hypothetical protein